MSIENQRLLLRAHAERLSELDGAEVVEFVDNGYTGTNFERPAVQELLELVKLSKVACIIVKDFTRFGRNSIETGYFIEQVFPLFGTRFIALHDDFDSADYKGDTGGIDVAFRFLMGEQYSRDLSEKSKSAKYAKMRRGEYQSAICCYGYKKGTDGRLAVDEDAAQVVRFIFQLSGEGKTAKQILDALYAKGIPTPGEYKAANGRAHHDISKTHGIGQRSTVLRILEDERYIGTYVIGKRAVKEVGGSRSRLRDASEWIRLPEHHPAIVDAALFEKVQSGLRHFTSEKQSVNQYPLRGKVFCGCCGHAMIRLNREKPAFVCRHSKVDSTFSCHGLEIQETELEELLFGIISKQAELLLRVDVSGGIRTLNQQLDRRVKYEKMMTECHDAKRLLYESYMTGAVDAAAYKAQKAICDKRLSDLTRIHTALSAQTLQMRLEQDSREQVQAAVQVVSGEHSLTQEAASLLIDRVLIFPGNRVDIQWHMRDFMLDT